MKFSKSSIRKTNAVYILSLTMSHMGTLGPFLLPFTSEALELLEQPTSKAKKFTYTPYPTFYFFLINQACAVVSEKSVCEIQLVSHDIFYTIAHLPPEVAPR